MSDSLYIKNYEKMSDRIAECSQNSFCVYDSQTFNFVFARASVPKTDYVLSAQKD